MLVPWRPSLPSRRQGCTNKDAQAQRQNPGAKTPQPAQQQADVVTSATQHCVHLISQGSLEPVAPELAVSFHVSDSRLDSATPLYHRLQPARHAAPLPRAQDTHTWHLGAAVSAAHDGGGDRVFGNDARLLQRFG